MRLLNPLAWWQGDKPKSKARRTPARRTGARNPKRGLRKADNRRLWQRGGIVLAAGLVFGGMGWLWSSGWIHRSLERVGLAVLAATADAGLELGDVLVEGRERTERRVVLETLGVVRSHFRRGTSRAEYRTILPRRGPAHDDVAAEGGIS